MRNNEITEDAFNDECTHDRKLKRLRACKRGSYLLSIGVVWVFVVGSPVLGAVLWGLDLALLVTLEKMRMDRRKRIKSRYLF
jgi:hypothetical protein